MILPALQGQNEIKTVVQAPSGVHPQPDLTNIRPMKRVRRLALSAEFVWKVVPPEERQEVQEVSARGKTPVNVGVDVSEDNSHLNKRRRQARVRKVTEAVLRLKGGLPFSKELQQVADTPLE
jgi:hypothetical protein